MPNPYEMTALEDPSAMYDELPRGGGRIGFQSGDVRSFQFDPPSVEDRDNALRAAAARATQFDAIKNASDEARYYEDLISNTRDESVSADVEKALQFQSMRKFERDIAIAKTSGLSPEQATIQAIIRNPKAFGSGSAGMVNALQEDKTFTPTWVQSPEGTYLRHGRYGEQTSFPPREAADPNSLNASRMLYGLQKERDAAEKARIELGEVSMISTGKTEKKKKIEAADKRIQDIQNQIDSIMQGGAPVARPSATQASEQATGTPEATPSAASLVSGRGEPGKDYVFNNEEDARAAGHGNGSVVRLKGIGKVRLR